MTYNLAYKSVLMYFGASKVLAGRGSGCLRSVFEKIQVCDITDFKAFYGTPYQNRLNTPGGLQTGDLKAEWKGDLIFLAKHNPIPVTDLLY